MKNTQKKPRIVTEIIVDRISDGDPQSHMLLAGLMSTTMQIIDKESRGTADLTMYEKSFDRMLKQAAEEEFSQITPEVMQELIIRHFNNRAMNHQMAIPLDVSYLKEKLRQHAKEKQQRGRGGVGGAAIAEHAHTLPKP